MAFTKEEIEHIQKIKELVTFKKRNLPANTDYHLFEGKLFELINNPNALAVFTQTGGGSIGIWLACFEKARATRVAICLMILSHRFDDTYVPKVLNALIEGKQATLDLNNFKIDDYSDIRFNAMCHILVDLQLTGHTIKQEVLLALIKKIPERIEECEKLTGFEKNINLFLDSLSVRYSRTIILLDALSKSIPNALEIKNELSNCWLEAAHTLRNKGNDYAAIKMLNVLDTSYPNFKNSGFEIFEYLYMNSVARKGKLMAFIKALPFCKDQKNELILLDAQSQKLFDAILHEIVGKKFSPDEKTLLDPEERQKWVKKVESVADSFSIFRRLKKDNPSLSQQFEKASILGEDLLDDKKRENWISKITSVDDIMYHLNRFKIDKLNERVDLCDSKKYKQSIHDFYNQAVPIILSDKSKLEQRAELKQLAHEQFKHRHFWRRALADALMLVSILFAGVGLVIGFSRLARHKPFLFSLAPTNREKAILSRIDHVEGYKCCT